eukprot:TRINITY_DN15175_c0_g1_i1.p1 TRINITY_DN15175_c0_g1~~TRINITY_DN15175_c0_g1_i1.p1  ORF type:complete len:638 (+),score=122.25 TRINITY_DN15175_c0_g1_i1:47-1915(+)
MEKRAGTAPVEGDDYFITSSGMTMDMHPREEVKTRQNNNARRASGTFRSPTRTPGRRNRSHSDERRKDAEGDVTSSEDDDIQTITLISVPEDAAVERVTLSEPTSPQSKSTTQQFTSAQRNRSVSLATGSSYKSTAARQLNFDDDSSQPSVSSSSSSNTTNVSSSLFPLPQQAVELPFATMGPTSAAAWTAAFSNLVSPRTSNHFRPPVWAQELFEAIERLKRDLESVKHLVPAFEGIERRVEEMSQAIESYEADAGGEEKISQAEGDSASMSQAPTAALPDEKTLRDAVSAVARTEVSSAFDNMDIRSKLYSELEDVGRSFREKLEKSVSDRVLSSVSESLQSRIDEAYRSLDSTSESSIQKISSAVQSHLADMKRELESTLQGSLDRATSSAQSRIREALQELEGKHNAYVAKLAEEKKTALAELHSASNDLWTRFDRGIQQVKKDRSDVSEMHDKIMSLGDSLRSQVQEIQKASKSVSELSDIAKNASSNCEIILCQLKPLLDHTEAQAGEPLSPDAVEPLSVMETAISQLSTENVTLRNQVSTLSDRLQELETQFDRRLASAAASASQVAASSTLVKRVEERVLPNDFAKILFLGCIAFILLAQLLVQHPPEQLNSFM